MDLYTVMCVLIPTVLGIIFIVMNGPEKSSVEQYQAMQIRQDEVMKKFRLDEQKKYDMKKEEQKHLLEQERKKPRVCIKFMTMDNVIRSTNFFDAESSSVSFTVLNSVQVAYRKRKKSLKDGIFTDKYGVSYPTHTIKAVFFEEEEKDNETKG